MKLSIATPEQKLRALAELDGWVIDSEYHKEHGYASITGKRWSNYLERYDAIIPLIQKLDDYSQTKIENFICSERKMFSVTPSQLCDAVLIATGKFEV